MYRGICVVLILFVTSLLVSCNANDAVSPAKDSLSTDESVMAEAGELHNEILSAYAAGNNLFLARLRPEEATKRFVRAANTVLKKHAIDFRVDEKFIHARIAEFKKFKEESGYDIFTIGSDPDVALGYLEEKGVITRKRVDLFKKNLMIIKNEYRDSGELPQLLPKDEMLSWPEIDIMVHSAQWWKDYYDYMEGYVQEHPELKGWWDRWKKRIREWLLIGSDAIGGLAGMGGGAVGTIIGAALASITFTIVWGPY